MKRLVVNWHLCAAAVWLACVPSSASCAAHAAEGPQAAARQRAADGLNSAGPRSGAAATSTEIRSPALSIRPSGAPADAAPSPALLRAYEALQARDYDTAARLYEDLARTDPGNMDVLLGRAAIAVHRGELRAARDHYLAVLRLDPRNAAAEGALLAVFGVADFVTAELRLKALLTREPSAFLYHALGTLYADQWLWPQAQHAYLHAHRLETGNADHAYNLAVSLDRVGQYHTAIAYYRRAAELARTRGSSFDVRFAEDRAAHLGTRSLD